MRRIAFRVAAAEKEALLDALLPLLPGGVSERPDGDAVELAAVGDALPHRAALEAAAGAPLAGWEEARVSADWRERRARFGGGGFLVADRILLRSPDDPPATDPHVLDLVLERGGGGFGSGSHTTTRMCLELLLGLEPDGSAADLGCGLGTLAIAAARLGWEPVTAVEIDAGALETISLNAATNRVAVTTRWMDLTKTPAPWTPVAIANLPRTVLVQVLIERTPELLIASGVLAREASEVASAFGLREQERRTHGDWAAVVLA